MDKEQIIKIYTFQAFDGDSFLVTISGIEKQTNILIDCGSKDTYQNFIKPYLLQMSRKGQKIDYLILTHVHSDHIGGAIPLLLENGNAQNANIIEIGHVIYNGYLGLSLKDYPKGECLDREKRIFNGIISQGQAVLGNSQEKKQVTLNEEMCISKLLLQGGYRWNAWNDEVGNLVMADSQMKINIGEDSYLQFISPNRQQLIRMNAKWEEYLKRIYRNVPQMDNDLVRNAYEAFHWIVNNTEYDTLQGLVSSKELNRDAIEQLAIKKYNYDCTEENKESIAFILSAGNKKILFLGDANIEICRQNLEKIYGRQPTSMNLIKLAHHGSKHNISTRFLDQFGSTSYLISAGTTDNRPSMETIAKLLVNQPLVHKKIYTTNRNRAIECYDVGGVHASFSFEFLNAADTVIEI